MNLPQLQEAVNAVAIILKDLHDAKSDDGKISTPEIVGIAARDLVTVIKAIKGANEIPQELRSLDQKAMDDLYYGFLTTIGWDPSDYTRDKFATVYSMVSALITGSIQWMNTVHPPKAVPV